MLPHRRLYAWSQANAAIVDLLLALGATLVFACPFLLVALYDVSALMDFVLSAAICMALAWRRTKPVEAGAVQLAACLLQLFLVPVTGLPADIFVIPMVHALAAYGPRWASLAGLVLALVGGALFLLRYFVLPASSGLGLYGTLSSFVSINLLGLVAIEATVLAAWTFGDLARTRRLTLQALEDRARRLEIERQQERDLAAADERSHIAREMHDIVAHSLSVIITQADGARYASADDPEVARQTLGVIADTGRGSLREMRRLLGVLRGDDEASTRPLPSLADLEDLVESVRRAGLTVLLAITDVPRRALPAGAELTAYRVVQEALTNVLKHAGPDVRADVRLGWTTRGLDISVHDDGRGASTAVSADGAGQGINGMHERVGLYDGTVAAGPARGGGFSVFAFIPYTEA